MATWKLPRFVGILLGCALLSAVGCKNWTQADTATAVTVAETVIDLVKILAEKECAKTDDQDTCLGKMQAARFRARQLDAGHADGGK